MNKDICGYFEDLEKSRLKKRKGAFLFDETCKENGYNVDTAGHILEINNTSFYKKPWREEFSINTAVASDLYRQLDIITPPIYKLVKKHNPLHFFKNTFYEISEDALNLENCVCTIAENEPRFAYIRNMTRLDGYKWMLLYDSCLRNEFLKFMTEECFEEYVLCFLLAELRTDADLHDSNFILCKNKNSKKWEHIIPIDMELSKILNTITKRRNDFLNFINIGYSTYGPDMWMDDEVPYKQRLKDIKEIINDNVLSENIIQKLKLALNYDYPEKIKENFKKFNDKDFHNSTYNAFANLWEYNRNTLKDDLGL